MGDAKRKAKWVKASHDALGSVEKAKLAQAVRQVVAASNDFHGSDCLLFASVGAGVLRALGVDAQMVAGSAIWRLGPGDADTLSHAREMQSTWFAPSGSKMPGGARHVPFHAWIEGPGLLVDFSTCTLRLKAGQLDAADGGKTQVDWAPDFIWDTYPFSASRLKTPHAVNASFDTGVYCYVRHLDIEADVMSNKETLATDAQSAIAAAHLVYRSLCSGQTIQVVGVGKDSELQTQAVSQPLAPLDSVLRGRSQEP